MRVFAEPLTKFLTIYSNYEAETHIVNIKVINHDTGINRNVSPIIARLWIYY